MRSKRFSAVMLGVVALMVFGFGVAPALGATGAQTASPPPVTDYGQYPLGLGLIPDGCTSEGASLLRGEQFSVNGGTPVSSLRDLGVIPSGATITMTWTGFATGCENVGLSLSRKIALTPGFDPTTNQYLNVWSYCGPGGDACTGTLALDLADAGEVNCYQYDATAGPPLRVVGPDGSFYSSNGGFNMLISANNGGSGDCTPTPCPEPGAPPGLPAGAEECRPPASTTSAPASSSTSTPTSSTTTTTSSSTTTSSPPSSSTSSPASTTSTSQPPSSTSSPAQSTTIPQSSTTVRPPISTAGPAETATTGAVPLPKTGGSQGDLGRVGLALLATGLLLSAAAIRWRNA